jgi:hypothetical protein
VCGTSLQRKIKMVYYRRRLKYIFRNNNEPAKIESYILSAKGKVVGIKNV